ncbi:MAG: hypothetical protein KBD78_08045 [Oligoflexales bacterium]|nr:hypothetical protein [Oligoflexales bacterium]
MLSRLKTSPKLFSLIATLILSGILWVAIKPNKLSEEVNQTSEFSFKCLDDTTENLYNLDYQSEGYYDPTALNLAQLGQEKTEIDIRVNGIFKQSCAQNSNGINFFWNFVQLEVDSKDERTFFDASSTLQLNFSTLPEGIINEIYFPENLSKENQHILRDVLNHISLSIPKSFDMKLSFETNEVDPNGVYRATYKAQEKDNFFVLEKKRIEYLQPDDSTKDFQKIIQDNSINRFEISKSNRIIMNVDAVLDIEHLYKNQLFSKTKTKMVLKHLDKTKSNSLSANSRPNSNSTSNYSNEVKSDLSASKELADIDLQMYRNSLGNETWASLSSKLYDEVAEEDRTNLFLQLKSLLMLQPELSFDLADLLHKFAPDTDAYRLTLSSLVSAGHPQAQSALIKFLQESSGDQEKQITVIGQLGLVEHPSDELNQYTENRIQNESDPDILTTLYLQQGNNAKAQENSNPAVNAKSVASYLKLLQSGKIQDQILALEALGNAGSVLAIDAILEKTFSSNSTIRTKALAALRLIQGIEAEQAILAYYERHSEQSEKKAAIEALFYRELSMSGIAFLRESYRTNMSSDLQLAILECLKKYIDKDAKILIVFQQASAQQTHKEVSRSAANVLAQQNNL